LSVHILYNCNPLKCMFSYGNRVHLELTKLWVLEEIYQNLKISYFSIVFIAEFLNFGLLHLKKEQIQVLFRNSALSEILCNISHNYCVRKLKQSMCRDRILVHFVTHQSKKSMSVPNMSRNLILQNFKSINFMKY
jgi:hypothetical protein